MNKGWLSRRNPGLNTSLITQTTTLICDADLFRFVDRASCSSTCPVHEFVAICTNLPKNWLLTCLVSYFNFFSNSELRWQCIFLPTFCQMNYIPCLFACSFDICQKTSSVYCMDVTFCWYVIFMNEGPVVTWSQRNVVCIIFCSEQLRGIASMHPIKRTWKHDRNT